MGIGLVLVVNEENAHAVVDFINTRESKLEIEIYDKYKELIKDKAYIIGEVVDTHEGVNLC